MRFRGCVRHLEEYGQMSYIAILLEATSLSDLLARMDMVGEVIAYNKQVQADMTAAREKVETVKAELEDARTELQDKQSELETKQVELQQKVSESRRRQERVAHEGEYQRNYQRRKHQAGVAPALSPYFFSIMLLGALPFLNPGILMLLTCFL